MKQTIYKKSQFPNNRFKRHDKLFGKQLVSKDRARNNLAVQLTVFITQVAYFNNSNIIEFRNYKPEMKIHTCLSVLIVILCLVNECITIKFRSEKVNYIYEKALQHISDRKRLQKLEDELLSYDKIYMETKSMHLSGSVNDLNKELAKVDEKLINVLEKFGLQQTVQAFKEKMKHRNSNKEETKNLTIPLETFSDERLQKLWLDAKNSKFSDTELIELYEELKEVERKTARYDDALKEYNKVPVENSLQHTDNTELDDKTAQVKAAHRAMNDHYEQLQNKISNTESSPFKDDKVKKLWKLAQTNRNFSAHDLEVMKDELLHFDKHLKKIALHKVYDISRENFCASSTILFFLQSELDAIRSNNEKEGKTTLQHLENTEMEAKHERMDRKLRKLEKYLEAKVRHSEL
uniref:Alpha-2-MRAP_C domain-containing protein n=1 Tax=Heterorhabditis bacteriophora TaxID=37862 RepID=A0A1I7XP59_HETBA